MVAAAGVIAPALAGADEDTGIGAARGLAHLDINIVVVERDLTRHSDYVERKEAPLARDNRVRARATIGMRGALGTG